MIHSRPILAFLLSSLFSLAAYAQTTLGIQRVKIGSLEVTAVLDGELKLDPALLKGLNTSEINQLLGNSQPVVVPVNAYVVRMNHHTLLVDAGGTKSMNPGLGNLVERLRKAGIDPESIEAVLITHLHEDHTGALLTPEGKRAFPKAQIRLAQAEHDHWTNPAMEAQLPEPYQSALHELKTAIATYQSAGAYHPFAPGETPFPGVRVLSAPGHTPGHTIYAFGSGKNTFWAMGDIIHFGQVQFQRPEATVAFDSNSTEAAASRLKILNRAAREGVVLGGSHVAFPGLGRVESRPQGFAWKPLP